MPTEIEPNVNNASHKLSRLSLTQATAAFKLASISLLLSYYQRGILC